MQSKDPDPQESRSGVATRPRTPEEPDAARRVTLAVALGVTFVFLLATAAGAGWLLSGGGPWSTASDGSGESAGDEEAAGREEPGAGDTAGGSPAREATVEDPVSGLSYRLPGEGWRRLGDDEVPPEYSSSAVYGSPDDPEAFIVTGSRDLDASEPLPVSGARLALDALGGLVSDVGSLRVEPSGATEVDGSPAFEAAVEDDAEGSYGRFLLVETGDRKGAFVLGLDTGGSGEASAAIDEAFDTLELL